MCRNIRFSTSAIAASLISVALLHAQPSREIAITIDDLPIAGVLPRSIESSRELTRKLLTAIAAHGVPAIGFVNENKLETSDGTVDPQRVQLLRQWLDRGLELGNHGYSHLDLHHVPIDAFEEDLLKGERVTRPLLVERRMPLRFFRHPFLHTGPSLETKAAFERFLGDHGYRVAPVTVDNDEYIFAQAYDRSSPHGDDSLTARIGDAYVPYMEAKMAFFENNSRQLFGREMRQVLLIHANMLNADRFDALASMLEGRGYRFITLDRALEDPAFASPDTFVGTSGITWIHRWALTRKMPKTFYADEPEVPRFVSEAAQR
jgi:peptidoglycan/xylan/chitin deacetylase (PgdA/CDA1 family)